MSQPTIRTEQGYDFVESQPMLEMKEGDGRDDVRHEHQRVSMTIEVDESSDTVGRYRIVGSIRFEETQQLPCTLSVRFDVVDVTIHHDIDSRPKGQFGSAKEVMNQFAGVQDQRDPVSPNVFFQPFHRRDDQDLGKGLVVLQIEMHLTQSCIHLDWVGGVELRHCQPQGFDTVARQDGLAKPNSPFFVNSIPYVGAAFCDDKVCHTKQIIGNLGCQPVLCKCMLIRHWTGHTVVVGVGPFLTVVLTTVGSKVNE